jgi:hypothetical protein
MGLADNLPRFSTPTHAHNFDNHCNGYNHSKTALVRSFSGLPEIGFFKGFETQKRFWNLARVTIFKIATLLIGLGSSMICTHDLIVLTKTKETTHYYGSFGYGGKMLSTHDTFLAF